MAKQALTYQPAVTGAEWLSDGSMELALKRRRFSIKKILKRTALLIIVAILGVGGYLGWTFYSNASKLTGNKNPLALLSAFTGSTLKETNGRVNILLAGYSADDPGHDGAELTDSIMIISIDPTDKSAVIISVPRDLYVNIPGYGYSKINAAYEYGEANNFTASGYANGGMGLLEQTLTQDFGVSFNYEALINYAAFKDTVNAVGGVTVNIASSNPAGLYDPYTNLQLSNGEHALTGAEALNLARARGDGNGSYGFSDGDFDRTQHQQELLVALKDKISTASVISNPLKIANLANAIGSNVTTDMSIGEMETLYTKVKGISDSSITSVTLNSYNGTNYLSYYTTEDGQSALIPAAGIGDYSDIQALVNGLLTTPTAQ